MERSPAQGRRALVVSMTAMLIIWTVLLPWIGAQPSVRSEIEFLNQQGVDPSALYYTDLDAMKRIESELAAISAAHPDALWSVRSKSSE